MSNDTPDPRRSAPAAARNRDAILAVLSRVLPSHGTILEIASGTGQHAVHFAAALPTVTWQPTDPDPRSRQSIEAWRLDAALANLQRPLALDVRDQPWNAPDALAGVVCINMIHIAPWEAAVALFEGAGQRLVDGGTLFLYGPYKRDGAHTAPSNAAFDQQLRNTDERWGVRDLEHVEALGRRAGLALREVVPMPANNFSLVFQRDRTLA
jgi:Protein of unknown function (DUF938)